MPAVGLVAEGEYDVPALKILIQRLLSHPIQIIDRPCHGEGNVVKLAPALIQEIRGEANISKALVIRDLGTKTELTPAKLKALMKGGLEAENFPFPAIPLVIVRELEAWFLADEVTLSEITGYTIQTLTDPERIKHPKDELKGILGRANPKVPYTPATVEDIARRVRLDILAARCRSFREFRDAVLNP